MKFLTAFSPLLGFFFALLAYWNWSRAKEASMDANLQQKFWNHSKYNREFEKPATPLEIAEWFRQEQLKFKRLALLLSVFSLLCFAFTAYALTQAA